jgi:hypothetical protein
MNATAPKSRTRWWLPAEIRSSNVADSSGRAETTTAGPSGTDDYHGFPCPGRSGTYSLASRAGGKSLSRDS